MTSAASAAALLLLVTALSCTAAEPPLGTQVVPRDAFPVFDDPEVMTADEAEAREAILDNDAVIGVRLGDESRAYPVTVMGVHELGNDTLAGVPITVSW